MQVDTLFVDDVLGHTRDPEYILSDQVLRLLVRIFGVRRRRRGRLSQWAEQLGGFDALLNKASTTWRNLLPNKKTPGSKPEYLMLLKEYPALLKRPVLVFEDGRVVLGFKDAQYKKLFST